MVKHENMVHLSLNTRRFLLSSDTQDNAQYENVAGSSLTSSSPTTSSSQYENVPSPYLIADGSKDKTDNSAPVDSTNIDSPYYENIQPPIAPNKDAVISANETGDNDYVSMKSFNEPDGAYSQVIDD